jgi:hypothetical protein
VGSMVFTAHTPDLRFLLRRVLRSTCGRDDLVEEPSVVVGSTSRARPASPWRRPACSFSSSSLSSTVWRSPSPASVSSTLPKNVFAQIGDVVASCLRPPFLTMRARESSFMRAPVRSCFHSGTFTCAAKLLVERGVLVELLLHQDHGGLLDESIEQRVGGPLGHRALELVARHHFRPALLLRLAQRLVVLTDQLVIAHPFASCACAALGCRWVLVFSPRSMNTRRPGTSPISWWVMSKICGTRPSDETRSSSDRRRFVSRP